MNSIPLAVTPTPVSSHHNTIHSPHLSPIRPDYLASILDVEGTTSVGSVVTEGHLSLEGEEGETQHHSTTSTPGEVAGEKSKGDETTSLV